MFRHRKGELSESSLPYHNVRLMWLKGCSWGGWKLDLWFLDEAGYEKLSKYCDSLRLRLTPETRSAILEIKEAYWRSREYRHTITSDSIYRAVLDHDVRTVHQFARLLDIMAKSK